MNYLIIVLYTLAVFTIGLFTGLALKTSYDAEAFRKLEIRNRDLRNENNKLKKQTKLKVIEIRDERQQRQDLFAPF